MAENTGHNFGINVNFNANEAFETMKKINERLDDINRKIGEFGGNVDTKPLLRNINEINEAVVVLTERFTGIKVGLDQSSLKKTQGELNNLTKGITFDDVQKKLNTLMSSIGSKTVSGNLQKQFNTIKEELRGDTDLLSQFHAKLNSLQESYKDHLTGKALPPKVRKELSNDIDVLFKSLPTLNNIPAIKVSLDEKSLKVFADMEKHLSTIKGALTDVGDGKELQPLIQVINQISTNLVNMQTVLSKGDSFEGIVAGAKEAKASVEAVAESVNKVANTKSKTNATLDISEKMKAYRDYRDSETPYNNIMSDDEFNLIRELTFAAKKSVLKKVSQTQLENIITTTSNTGVKDAAQQWLSELSNIAEASKQETATVVANQKAQTEAINETNKAKSQTTATTPKTTAPQQTQPVANIAVNSKEISSTKGLIEAEIEAFEKLSSAVTTLEQTLVTFESANNGFKRSIGIDSVTVRELSKNIGKLISSFKMLQTIKDEFYKSETALAKPVDLSKSVNKKEMADSLKQTLSNMSLSATIDKLNVSADAKKKLKDDVAAINAKLNINKLNVPKELKDELNGSLSKITPNLSVNKINVSKEAKDDLKANIEKISPKPNIEKFNTKQAVTSLKDTVANIKNLQATITKLKIDPTLLKAEITNIAKDKVNTLDLGTGKISNLEIDANAIVKLQEAVSNIPLTANIKNTNVQNNSNSSSGSNRNSKTNVSKFNDKIDDLFRNLPNNFRRMAQEIVDSSKTFTNQYLRGFLSDDVFLEKSNDVINKLKAFNSLAGKSENLMNEKYGVNANAKEGLLKYIQSNYLSNGYELSSSPAFIKNLNQTGQIATISAQVKDLEGNLITVKATWDRTIGAMVISENENVSPNVAKYQKQMTELISNIPKDYKNLANLFQSDFTRVLNDNTIQGKKLEDELQNIINKVKELQTFSKNGTLSNQMFETIRQKYNLNPDDKESIFKRYLTSQGKLQGNIAFEELKDGYKLTGEVLKTDGTIEKVTATYNSNLDAMAVKTKTVIPTMQKEFETFEKSLEKLPPELNALKESMASSLEELKLKYFDDVLNPAQIRERLTNLKNQIEKATNDLKVSNKVDKTVNNLSTKINELYSKLPNSFKSLGKAILDEFNELSSVFNASGESAEQYGNKLQHLITRMQELINFSKTGTINNIIGDKIYEKWGISSKNDLKTLFETAATSNGGIIKSLSVEDKNDNITKFVANVLHNDGNIERVSAIYNRTMDSMTFSTKTLNDEVSKIKYTYTDLFGKLPDKLKSFGNLDSFNKLIEGFNNGSITEEKFINDTKTLIETLNRLNALSGKGAVFESMLGINNIVPDPKDFFKSIIDSRNPLPYNITADENSINGIRNFTAEVKTAEGEVLKFKGVYDEVLKIFTYNVSSKQSVINEEASNLEKAKAKAEELKKSFNDLYKALPDTLKDFGNKSNFDKLVATFNSGDIKSVQKFNAEVEILIEKLNRLKSLSGKKSIFTVDKNANLEEVFREQLNLTDDSKLKLTIGDTNIKGIKEFTATVTEANGAVKQFKASYDEVLNVMAISSKTTTNTAIDEKVTQLTKWEDEIARLQAKLNSKTFGIPQEFGSNLSTYNTQFENFVTEFNNLKDKGELTAEEFSRIKNELNAIIKNVDTLSSLSKKGNIIGNYADRNSALSAFKNYAGSQGKLLDDVTWEENNNGMVSFITKVKTAQNEILKLKGTYDTTSNAMVVKTGYMRTALTGLTKVADLIISKWKSVTSYITAMYLNPYMLFARFKEGLEIFKEFDSGLTNISYTMNLSQKGIDDLGESVLNMAKNLKTSINNAMDVSKIYANMNTSTEEMQKLSEPTLILSNLSGFDASAAADDIQAVTQQFKKSAEESMHIVDVYDYISKNIAVDYSKILELILETI